MAVSTSAGSKLFIGTTAASASGDTYTEIAEITNLGAFGRSYNEIKHAALGNRNDIKFKGQRDDGSISLGLGRSAGDPGQAAMLVALDSDHDYNFKVTLNDAITPSTGTPTTILFKAKVMSYVTNVGGVDQVVAATASLGITSGSIAETAAT